MKPTAEDVYFDELTRAFFGMLEAQRRAARAAALFGLLQDAAARLEADLEDAVARVHELREQHAAALDCAHAAAALVARRLDEAHAAKAAWNAIPARKVAA